MASLKRNHSSFIIDSDNYVLLMDAGDGISKALISQGAGFNKINGIIISHLHPDHFSGLPALLVQMKLSNRKNELDIFINQAVIEFVKKFLMQSYIFIDKMGFDINFKVYVDEDKSDVSGSLSFYSRQNSHLEKYKLYDTENIVKFACSSFLFEEKKLSVFYTGDIGSKEDLYLFGENDISIMISEVSHVPYEEILAASVKLKAQKLILTHIDDDSEEKIRSFFTRSEVGLGKDVTVAYDGLTVKT